MYEQGSISHTTGVPQVIYLITFPHFSLSIGFAFA